MYRVVHKYTDGDIPATRYVYRVDRTGFGMRAQPISTNNYESLVDAEALRNDCASHGWSIYDCTYIEVRIDFVWYPLSALECVEELVKL